MSTFLVTFATGRQAASTARQLLSAGHKVNALVTNRKSPRATALELSGATIHEGSLENESVLRSATEGVEGIFLNLIPSLTDDKAELRQTQAVLKLADEARTVRTIVLSTLIDTGKHKSRYEKNPGYPASSNYASKLLVEETVRDSGIDNVVILRPGWLMHNHIAPFTSMYFPELQESRTLVTALRPDVRMPFFDPDDVGKFAAAALLNSDQYAGQNIELGNELLTTEEAAKIMSRVAGVEVKFRHRSDDEVKELYDKIPTLRFQILANQYSLGSSIGSLDHFGIKLRSFEDFLKAESEQLREALCMK